MLKFNGVGFPGAKCLGPPAVAACRLGNFNVCQPLWGNATLANSMRGLMKGKGQWTVGIHYIKESKLQYRKQASNLSKIFI